MQLFSGKTDKTVVFSFEVASFLSLAVLYARFGAKCAEFRRRAAVSLKTASKKQSVTSPAAVGTLLFLFPVFCGKFA